MPSDASNPARSAAPTPAARDLLVEVRAVSVNPMDTKVRMGSAPEPGVWKVLGWNAAGVVTAGPDATLFRPGDAVFYAGAIGRPGSSSEYHLVDERIVGPKPRSLDWAEAATLPLIAITAWETLFDRLDVRRLVPGAAPAILIIGGVGGVGSAAIQVARAVTDLAVIATASRPETGNGRAPHGGPQQAAGRGGRSARDRGAGLRVLHHADAAPFRGGRRADRPAGPLRADR